MQKNKSPRILYLDIETSPLLSYTWDIWDQTIGLNQIKEDWRIISFAAKWADEREVIQRDLRRGINDKNEYRMLKQVWKLLDKSDIVVGQNSKRFDIKKLNDKFLKYKMGPPSSYRQIDTLSLSKKYFSPTSHKLEYRSKTLNKKYKKMEHSKFSGFALWKECMNNNQTAWKEMALYNVWDVLSTEEYHLLLQPWDNSINYSVFSDDPMYHCNCGSDSFSKNGWKYTNFGKYRRWLCKDCGSESKDKTNLLSKVKQKLLRN